MVADKPKKEDNADMVVVMEEDVDDEEEEEDFLGGRRIEERRPAEVGFLPHENYLLNISQTLTFTAELLHQVMFLAETNDGGRGLEGPTWEE